MLGPGIEGFSKPSMFEGFMVQTNIQQKARRQALHINLPSVVRLLKKTWWPISAASAQTLFWLLQRCFKCIGPL
jgi:hypothetical protein